MSRLADHVDAFVALCTSGRSLEAIEQYFADDVVVYENRELARAGRVQCLAFERDSLAKQVVPAKLVCRGRAVDEPTGAAFIRWEIRFTMDGTPMRLEEVAVQRWAGARVVEERFYYDGVVDESDETVEGVGT